MLLYAPTYEATRETKDKFFDTVQQALDGVPSAEAFVLLGDFNAHVGSRVSSESEWWYVRGPHGYGSLNEPGQELLS